MRNNYKVIEGSKHIDIRGQIVFANEFDTSVFQRCYHITHDKISVIRAWQGHQLESKAFWVTKGSFLFQWIAIDNFEHPDRSLKVETIVLNFIAPQILILQGGFANGFQALETDSSVMVFSDMSLEDSKQDDYRWDNNYFINAHWK